MNYTKSKYSSRFLSKVLTSFSVSKTSSKHNTSVQDNILIDCTDKVNFVSTLIWRSGYQALLNVTVILQR